MRLSSRGVFAAVIGLASVSQAAPVTAVLRLQEKVAIESLAAAAQNSPMTRGYTADEIRQIAGPDQADYQNLLQQLQDDGFAIVSESPTHLWVSVTADSSLFEKTFGTTFSHNANNERHALVEPQVPNHLGLIAGVGGLNSDRHAFPKFVKTMKKPTDDPGGLSRATITKQYQLDAVYAKGINGKGQHIAIATYNDFNAADVKYFYQYNKLSPMSTVDKVKFNGTPPPDENSAMETSLDAEFSGMIAPGAAVHVFSSATNDDAGELAMFTAILDDGRAHVVNYSWGACETQVTPAHAKEMEKVFARAVAQGVNILVASGDSGSDSCQDGSTVADWPAANDNVVAVGGTTLLSRGRGDYTEQAWNGSGGGISKLWSKPTWQKGLPAKYAKRSYPDVSFNADPLSGQAVYTHQNGTPGWLVIGGTSMAAPQWAGILALVGSARKAVKAPTLGYLNNIIYALPASTRSTLFTDITSGSNGAYSAGPGWDAVTGWGSPQAESLVTALSK